VKLGCKGPHDDLASGAASAARSCQHRAPHGASARRCPAPRSGGVDKPGETSQTDSPQSTGELLMTLRQVWWVTAVLAAAAVPARAADEKKDEKALIAHVALSGDLDEAPAGESIFGSDPGQNLKQKLDRIAKAKTDAKVKALLIELHDLKLGLFG